MYTKMSSPYSIGYSNGKMIQSILAEKDVELEEILDYENIVIEARSRNQDLSNFFSKNPDKVKALIDYIILEPSVKTFNDDKKRATKYPFIASEIFASELAGLINLFGSRSTFKIIGTQIIMDLPSIISIQSGLSFEEIPKMNQEMKDLSLTCHTNGKVVPRTYSSGDQSTEDSPLRCIGAKLTESLETELKLLPTDTYSDKKDEETIGHFLFQHLFSFLNQEHLNNLLAGYFMKAVMAIMSTQGSECLAFAVQSEWLIDRLIQNISERPIAQILIQFISASSCHKQFEEIVYLEERKNIIEKLFALLEKTVSKEEEVEALSFIVSQVLVHNRHSINAPREISKTFLSLRNIKSIFQRIKSGNEEVQKYCSFILHDMVQYTTNRDRMSSSINRQSNRSCSSDQDDLYGQYIEEFLKEIEENSAILIQEIQKDRFCRTVMTSYKEEAYCFGISKLKIMEVILSLLRANRESLMKLMCQTNFFSSLSDMILKFKFNDSFLNMAKSLFLFAIESGSKLLVDSIFEDAKVIDFIIINTQTTLTRIPKNSRNYFRNGHIGHIFEIANAIQRNRDLCTIEPHLKNRDDWEEFTTDYLSKYNRIEAQDLANWDDLYRYEKVDDIPSDSEEDEKEQPPVGPTDIYESLDIENVYEKYYYETYKKTSNLEKIYTQFDEYDAYEEPSVTKKKSSESPKHWSPYVANSSGKRGSYMAMFDDS